MKAFLSREHQPRVDVGPGPCGAPQEDAGFSHILGTVRRVRYGVLCESSLLLCLGR